MKLEDDICETMIRICDQFASAIERYDKISGGETPPEQLITSHVLMALGDILTMTVETNGGILWEWHANAIWRRRNSPQPGAKLPLAPPAPPAYAQFQQRRIDLVIYKGDYTQPSQMEFLCLVEFKFGWVDQNDIARLANWLPYIDTCPYGAICTALEVPWKSDVLVQHEAAAKQAGRRSVRGRVAHPLWSRQDWQTYAEILDNPKYRNMPAP